MGAAVVFCGTVIAMAAKGLIREGHGHTVLARRSESGEWWDPHGGQFSRAEKDSFDDIARNGREGGYVTLFRGTKYEKTVYGIFERAKARDATARTKITRTARDGQLHSEIRNLSSEKKAIVRAQIRAAAQDSLKDGSSWKANALYRLKRKGFTARQAVAIVNLAQAHYSR